MEQVIIDGGVSAIDEFIETIDVWELRHLHWPFMRALCRGYVEQRELRYYERALLATQRWSIVRCIPHRDSAGAVSSHVFDVYGVTA